MANFAYTATYSSRALFIEISSREALDAEAALLESVASSTPISAPRILKLDHSVQIIPSSYAILSHPPGTPLACARPGMSPQAHARTELRLGAHLRTLHAIQNDWFGLSGAKDEWGECYSWQEAFSLLLETALGDLQAAGLGGEREEEIPFGTLRRALGRAIGFFLFDDVEVPCLVWNSALEWDADAYVCVGGDRTADPEAEATIEGELTALANWGGALWGDPLMEGAFRTPSTAFLEGYGGSPIVFARQHTKRLWYTAYAALRALLAAATSKDKDTGSLEKERKARTLLMETAEMLKDAPCY